MTKVIKFIGNQFTAAAPGAAITATIVFVLIGQSLLPPSLSAQNRPTPGQRTICASGDASGYSCQEIDLLSILTPAELGASATCGQGNEVCGINDMWGWTDTVTGTEYAIVGREDGTAFVDISDPVNPVYLGDLGQNGTGWSVWRDIKVYDHFAYIVADGRAGNGVQVFDLSQLREVADPPIEFAMTYLYTGITSAHNIVVNEATGHAFAVGSRSTETNPCGRGLHMMNLVDPLKPAYAGCFQFPGTGRRNDGYTHDAQCVVYHGPDADYHLREICVGLNETHITVSDVSDLETPIAVSAATYPDARYIHQGWLSNDHRYLFQNDELDEYYGEVTQTRTLVWDMIDLDDPVLLTTFLSANTSIDHNIYVDRGYLYQSNYVDGLRILNIEDPQNPYEVAFFDMHHEDPENPDIWAGSWSNYPFFSSGVLAVTSRTEGLFLLQPTIPDLGTETEARVIVSTAYPNPFKDHLTISLVLPETERVDIMIYDLLGRAVQKAFTGTVEADLQMSIPIDMSGLPAGAYYYRISGGVFSSTGPITLVR